MKAIYLLLGILIVSCSAEDAGKTIEQSKKDTWLVDELNVTGNFSLFPLVIDPEFKSVANTDLPDDELVAILHFGSEVRVYPYLYTYENEVVNDTYQHQKFALSYCPITKSAVAFSRNGIFRASGYLFKDNLTPWDDKTESIWSQMLLRGIRGDQKNKRLNTMPIVETKWVTVKNHFPKAKVVKNLAGVSLASAKTPTPEETDGSSNTERPSAGEYVYGILDDFDNVNIFKYSDFNDKNRIDLTVGSENFIVYGNREKRIINAFKVVDFSRYEVLQAEFPYVLQSDTGVKYNVLGLGSNGSILEKPKYAYVAIWRAWEDFYTNFNFQ